MSLDRTVPPSQWEALKNVPITEIDAEVGVYLGPSFVERTSAPTLWHWCTGLGAPDRWIAMSTGWHTVVSQEPWHLEPSLLCPECGLHGFIRDGQWVSA